MGTKLATISKVYNKSDKPFKFVLSEPSEGTITLHHAPDGWQDAETTYSRHKTYGSVLRSSSTNELTFYKEGRDFLKNCYENTGIDCNATMTVYKLNTSTWVYDTYPSAGKFDFSTYQINEIGVKIQMMDTSFKEKVLNRASTEVNLISKTSIEGYVSQTALIDQVTMPDTSITNDDTATISGAAVTPAGQYVVPISAVTTVDFSEMTVPTLTTLNVTAAGFFQSSTDNRLIHITGTVDMDLYRGSNGSVEYTLVHINSSDVIQNIFTLLPDPPTALDSLNDLDSGISITVDQFITLNTGDSVILQVELTTGTSVLTGGELTVEETYTGSPETDVVAFAYYEAFLRICQLITDSDSLDTNFSPAQPNPFYSTFFGRTDSALQPQTPYAADGTGSLGFVTKGIFFRKQESLSYTIPVSLKDLFESLSAIYRLGMSIETIDGLEKVRIEALDDYFTSTVVVDLSSVLRSEDIEKQVIPDMFYKSAQFGYNKFEYDNNSGLWEFNTKGTWSTVTKAVQNDFKKISKYRADGQGIRLILTAPDHLDDNDVNDYDPTSDVKGDDDIFLISAVRNASVFDARTTEGFTSIGGSVYADESFNVLYSPGRMFKAWGANLYAGLIRSLNSTLRHQVTEKNSTLTSRLTTESADVDEDGDVVANDLTASRWLNEKYIVKAPLTLTQLNAIDANPNGLIKLGDATYKIDTSSGTPVEVEVTPAKYGWILELKTTNKDGMAEMEILRYNANVVTPV